jgi:hypothetical protein
MGSLYGELEGRHMEYAVEELLVLVKEQSDINTSKESTSITYEAAQRLMNAVLYCIRENDSISNNNEHGEAKVANVKNFPSAREAYDNGYRLVVEKIKEVNEIFNEIIIDFKDYGNRAYYDTVVKGIPEFFRWYDPRLNPMNHIILVDYNVLEHLNELEGVDLIYRYLLCIRMEQRFLKRFPEEYIRDVLKLLYNDYEDSFINISGCLLKKALTNMLIGVKLEKIKYEKSDYEKLQAIINNTNTNELEARLNYLLGGLIANICQGDNGLYSYLENEIPNITTELRNAVENDSLYNTI